MNSALYPTISEHGDDLARGQHGSRNWNLDASLKVAALGCNGSSADPGGSSFALDRRLFRKNKIHRQHVVEIVQFRSRNERPNATDQRQHEQKRRQHRYDAATTPQTRESSHVLFHVPPLALPPAIRAYNMPDVPNACRIVRCETRIFPGPGGQNWVISGIWDIVLRVDFAGT